MISMIADVCQGVDFSGLSPESPNLNVKLVTNPQGKNPSKTNKWAIFLTKIIANSEDRQAFSHLPFCKTETRWMPVLLITPWERS